MRSLIIFAAMFLLLVSSCRETKKPNPVEVTVNPPVEILSTVTGVLYLEGVGLPGVKIESDSTNCTTDSLGRFAFTNLKGNKVRLKFIHPVYRSIDTVFGFTNNQSISLFADFKSNTFFPLAIGNTWTYTGDNDEYKYSITDTLTITGLKFYKLEVRINNNLQNPSYYYSWSNDSLLKYNPQCNGIEIPIISHFSENEKYRYHTCKNETKEATIVEKAKDSLFVGTRTVGGLDSEISYHYKRGIGMSSYSVAFGPLTVKLKSFIINNSD